MVCYRYNRSDIYTKHWNHWNWYNGSDINSSDISNCFIFCFGCLNVTKRINVDHRCHDRYYNEAM